MACDATQVASACDILALVNAVLRPLPAEFVQMAPAESVFRDGVQIVLRPPRLSLARISGERH